MSYTCKHPHAVLRITGAAVAREVQMKMITYVRNVVYVKHPHAVLRITGAAVAREVQMKMIT